MTLKIRGAKIGAYADWLLWPCWHFNTESLRHHAPQQTANHLGLITCDTTVFLGTASTLASVV